MPKKRVVVKGGGANLYRISISGNKHFVQHASVGLLMNSYKDIGKTSSLDDSLSLIRSHSGNEIKEISDE